MRSISQRLSTRIFLQDTVLIVFYANSTRTLCSLATTVDLSIFPFPIYLAIAFLAVH